MRAVCEGMGQATGEQGAQVSASKGAQGSVASKRASVKRWSATRQASVTNAETSFSRSLSRTGGVSRSITVNNDDSKTAENSSNRTARPSRPARLVDQHVSKLNPMA